MTLDSSHASQFNFSCIPVRVPTVYFPGVQKFPFPATRFTAKESKFS